jgi:hypothetical protein
LFIKCGKSLQIIIFIFNFIPIIIFFFHQYFFNAHPILCHYILFWHKYNAIIILLKFLLY